METKISLTRQSFLIEDVDMLGFRITNMTRSGGDSSTLVSLEEMTNIISSLQQQININSDSINLIDNTDGLVIGAIPLSEKGSINGVVPLDSIGKISPENLPLMSIRDVFVVNNEMDKLALIAQKGDIALVESTKQSYILAENLPSSNDSWVKFHTLADIYPINGVQGKIGDVVLTAQDVGSVPLNHPTNHFFYNPVFENIVSLDSNVIEYHTVVSTPQLSPITLSSATLNSPKYLEFTTSEIVSRYTIVANSPTSEFPVYWKLVGSDDDFSTSEIIDDIRLPLENWATPSRTFDITYPRIFSKYRFVFFLGGSGSSINNNILINSITLESNLSSVSVIDSSEINNAGFYEWKTTRLENTNSLQKVSGQIVLGTENVFQNGQLLDYSEDYSFVVGVNTSVSNILPTNLSISDVSYISDKSKLTANEVSLIVENFPQFIGTSSTFNGTSLQSSGQQLDYQTYRLIDKSTSTYWDSLPVFTGSGYTGSSWVMISFSSPKYLGWYSITPSSISTYSPSSWVLEASNDASIWVQLDAKNDIPAFTTKQDFEIPEHSEFYRFYRITFTKAFNSFIRIVEIDFFNKLFGEITRQSTELSDPSRWFQNSIGYGYNVPNGINNAGLASGYWRVLFGWDNGVSRTVDMYTMSQWG